MKNNLLTIVLSLVFGTAAAFVFHQLHQPETQETALDVPPFISEIPQEKRQVNFNAQGQFQGLDFTEASAKTTPAVVFIKTTSQVQTRSIFHNFFDFDPFGSIGKVSSSGSGVIVSDDGYIVTNFHVVQNADDIEVVLNKKKRTYKATLIGKDPSSDLALLKIDGENLPIIAFDNSDDVKTGQWVLAVGNPFNLTSTVTAGIVSAKGRNINIVNNQFPIESFIQTDAAINPGNSGGALVNLEGNLVGVNTAIASKTGSYVGYGFAIPSNLVKKIVKDLKEYGQLQRGFTGIEVVDIDEEVYKKTKADEGVYVSRVDESLTLTKGEIEIGDIITKVNGKPIEGKSNYDEQIAYYRPGDVLSLELIRDDETQLVQLKLLNKEGTSELIKRESVTSEILGADFELVSKVERDLYQIKLGIKTTNIRNGYIRKMNIPEGFIFTKINGKSFNSLEDFVDTFENLKGQVRIEGISQNGGRRFMSFYLN